MHWEASNSQATALQNDVQHIECTVKGMEADFRDRVLDHVLMWRDLSAGGGQKKRGEVKTHTSHMHRHYSWFVILKTWIYKWGLRSMCNYIVSNRWGRCTEEIVLMTSNTDLEMSRR